MIASAVDHLRRVEMMEAEEATATWIATTGGALRTKTVGGRCMGMMTEGAVGEEEVTVEDGEAVVEETEEEDQEGTAAVEPLRWLRG